MSNHNIFDTRLKKGLLSPVANSLSLNFFESEETTRSRNSFALFSYLIRRKVDAWRDNQRQPINRYLSIDARARINVNGRNSRSISSREHLASGTFLHAVQMFE